MIFKARLFLSAIIFTIERFITLGKASGSGDLNGFVRKIQGLLDSRDIPAALKECDKQKGSVGNVMKAGLHRYKEMITDNELTTEQKVLAIQKEVEEATTLELPMLEKNLNILATIASIATLMGLLGTVLGMIRAFAAMGSTGQPDTAARLGARGGPHRAQRRRVARS